LNTIISNERKFIVKYKSEDNESTVIMKKLNVKWIADSEIPLYNTITLTGEVGPRTTDICEEETAYSHTSEQYLPDPNVCERNRLFASSISTTPFQMFFSNIPYKNMDQEYQQELGNMWGGLCFVWNEKAMDQWPYAEGEPGGSDPKNQMWIMITGPRYDTFGRPCDPIGPTGTDGTGGIWQPTGQTYLPLPGDDSSRYTTNRSFRGRSGWGLPIAGSLTVNENIVDPRTYNDFTITNINSAVTELQNVKQVIHPENILVGSPADPINSQYPWGPAGNPTWTDTQIYHTLSGTSGEVIQVNYSNMVNNIIDLVHYIQTAPTEDVPLARKPTGLYGMPYISLWGQPIMRGDIDTNTYNKVYSALTSDEKEQLKYYSYQRVKSILSEVDIVQPGYNYSLYTDDFLYPVSGAEYEYPSPFFNTTTGPWNGAEVIEIGNRERIRDQYDIAKLANKPVYPFISHMMFGGGQIIEMGSEYNGFYYTNMCNPDCVNAHGVVGNCYENKRCWKFNMPIKDFIYQQVKPVKDKELQGFILWWSPTYSQNQSAAATREMGVWWSNYTDINPDLTQYNISLFPNQITGPENNRISIGTHWDLDTYAPEIIREINRLRSENSQNPQQIEETNKWINSYPLAPSEETSLYEIVNGRVFKRDRQQIYNYVYNIRKFMQHTYLDGADPMDPDDSRLSGMSGVSNPTETKGWHSPALNRLLKVISTKFQLHYVKAAKLWIDTETLDPTEWDVVTAFGGQEQFNSILQDIADDPIEWQPQDSGI
jgi:hypothetical protein